MNMEQTIINNEDYKLKITKTWVESTNVWHIKITSQSIFDRSFEMFLDQEELDKFKDVL
jgi:hypothetical protein